MRDTITISSGPFVALRRQGYGQRINWRLSLLLVALGGVAAFFGSLNAYYVTVAHILDMARQASVLVAVALGANAVIVAGEIDLSPGAVIGLVSVAIPGLLDLKLPTPLVLLVGLLIGTTVGGVNGMITLRLMVPSFLTTLGTMAIVRGAAIFVSNQPREIYNDQFTMILSDKMFGVPETVIYAGALALTVALFWRHLRFSLHVRAVGSQSQSALLAGVDPARTRMLVFMVAGTLSAAAALLLLGQTQTGLAASSEGIELNAIAAVILGGGRLGGGKGSVVGTVLGAVLLTAIFSGIAGLGLTAAWQLLFKGVILLVVILLMRD